MQIDLFIPTDIFLDQFEIFGRNVFIDYSQIEEEFFAKLSNRLQKAFNFSLMLAFHVLKIIFLRTE